MRLATFVVEAIVNGAVPVASVLVMAPVAEIVVKAAAAGVPPPIAPGALIVAPERLEAFRLATFVLEATTSGAVPFAKVLVIWPVALTVVKAPAAGVVPPMAPGAACM